MEAEAILLQFVVDEVPEASSFFLFCTFVREFPSLRPACAQNALPLLRALGQLGLSDCNHGLIALRKGVHHQLKKCLCQRRSALTRVCSKEIAINTTQQQVRRFTLVTLLKGCLQRLLKKDVELYKSAHKPNTPSWQGTL